MSHDLLEFFALSERLKKELRHSWLSDGRRESVAEHTWMMSLMAITLAPQLEHPVDLGHVLKLITVHDLAETKVGDIPVFERSARKDVKERAEQEAMTEIGEMLPRTAGTLISDLWNEYEAGITMEARFARALDHLEVQMQHNLADLETWLPLELDLVYTKMDDRCAHDSTLQAMAVALRTQAEMKLSRSGVDIGALRARHASPPSKDEFNH
jgi:putative hydrolase of HD superfamily